MIRINDIIDKILLYNSNADINLIDKAYVYSARVHAGQVRLSGEPYLSHPLEVAYILADMKLDVVSIAAGLLHDIIEDTHTTPEKQTELFGNEICNIVKGVTKLSVLPFRSAQERQAESLRNMILAMADDIRVILIKLADRLHNMRTLQYHKTEDKKKKIAKETLDIYAPITGRLGINWIKKELEDTAFKYLYSNDYFNLKAFISKSQDERRKYVEEVNGLIKKEMGKAGLKSKVFGRYKYFYSIYNKMKQQNLPFDEVYDIIAFRIILDTIPQCYKSLGIIHALWKPIPKKFKDYIGTPKPNMYQSLHTTVVGPYGERIEIQIRTQYMDKVAKSGIAAHWSYKERKSADEYTNKTFAWLQNLVENQKNFNDPAEFMENVRIDLFPDEVYLFTPHGEIKSLPKGATPIDFAYSIHTEIGNQCVGAKADGHMVPLKYKLHTGNIVTIITKKGHQPSKDWLDFVKTVKARSKIRQYIKTEEKERSITLGREICEKTFRKYKLNFNILVKSDGMKAVIKDFGFKSLDDLIASIGYGKITAVRIARKFMSEDKKEKRESLLNKIINHVKKKKSKCGIIVKGIDDVLIKFGKCCQPVPGEPIIGYITRGYGVTVHRTRCINAFNMNPERRIDVSWNKKIAEAYPVKLKIHSYDRVGLLADLAASISKTGANILSANTQTLENKMVNSLFLISVENTQHLNKVLSSLRKVELVHNVERLN